MRKMSPNVFHSRVLSDLEKTDASLKRDLVEICTGENFNVLQWKTVEIGFASDFAESLETKSKNRRSRAVPMRNLPCLSELFKYWIFVLGATEGSLAIVLFRLFGFHFHDGFLCLLFRRFGSRFDNRRLGSNRECGSSAHRCFFRNLLSQFFSLAFLLFFGSFFLLFLLESFPFLFFFFQHLFQSNLFLLHPLCLGRFCVWVVYLHLFTTPLYPVVQHLQLFLGSIDWGVKTNSF
mmetsp:Transcript_17049/g.32364  ORF Transcript_17049/g.32364 Transcript_17049/m.32364 type:complete len:235 (-) Transcript_17049:1313-2017(-)